MAAGSPMFRNRAGSDNLVHGGWGVQPAGPLPANLYRPGGVRLQNWMPAKDAVDYVHSLTQTTLLLAGLAVFLFVHRGRRREALRKLAGRVT